VYEGLAVENKLANSAIEFTAGNVLFHQDEFPDTYYHSTCGGATDDIEHVWERKGVPYLKSVRDNGACSWSKYYNWQEAFSEEQLRNRLEQYLSTDKGKTIRLERIVDVVTVDRTPGGRVSLMLIQSGKEILRFRKDRIRWVIGRTSDPDLILPSDRFDVDLEKDSSGRLRRIIFRGSGYGHGVGMCQCGAIGMARNGRQFDTILKHYYTGVNIKKLY
jgi:stage II sporulation protein D